MRGARTLETRYRLNSPETLDGEALIVHLGTGSYFTVAARAKLSGHNCSPAAFEAAEALAVQFATSPHAVLPGGQEFVTGTRLARWARSPKRARDRPASFTLEL